MSAQQFGAALADLGWTHAEAARQLGRVGATLDRVDRWAGGAEPVPQGIANLVRGAVLIQRFARQAPYN
jgi:hypothetical protein